MGNDNDLVSNILEVSLYNFNRTVTDTFVERADIHNLTIPIEFYFPASESANLSSFLSDYNKLNPFRNKEKLRREQMIKKSGLKCVFWKPTEKKWSGDGCNLVSIDNTHIKCQCNHLSAFAITFVTPKLTTDSPLLENTTISV
jgi:hypothetical protein